MSAVPALPFDTRAPLAARANGANGANGAGVTVQGDTYHITLNAAPGQDEQTLLRLLRAERESYAGVRAHYHATGKAKRQSVVMGGDIHKNMKILPETYPNEAAARAAAAAEFQRTQRSQATMSYTLALGRPDVYPEMPVRLSGFKPEIDEVPWLAKQVTHKIDSSGLTTSLELEMNGDPVTERHRSRFRKGGSSDFS
jgi:phage protein D